MGKVCYLLMVRGKFGEDNEPIGVFLFEQDAVNSKRQWDTDYPDFQHFIESVTLND